MISSCSLGRCRICNVQCGALLAMSEYWRTSSKMHVSRSLVLDSLLAKVKKVHLRLFRKCC